MPRKLLVSDRFTFSRQASALGSSCLANGFGADVFYLTVDREQLRFSYFVANAETVTRV